MKVTYYFVLFEWPLTLSKWFTFEKETIEKVASEKKLLIAGVTDIDSSGLGYASETSTLLSCGGSLVSKNSEFNV